MQHAPDKVDELILQVARRFISVSGSDASDIRTGAAGDARYISQLVVRALAQSRDKGHRAALLDVLDGMLELGIYGVDEAIKNVTRGLHRVHRMEHVSTTRCAISLRVTQAARVTVGVVSRVSRSSMSMVHREDVIELVPDESVPTAALGSAAGEIAANGVEALLRAMQ